MRISNKKKNKQKKKQTKKSLKFFKMKRAAMHSKSLFVVLGSCPEHVRLLVPTVCSLKN